FEWKPRSLLPVALASATATIVRSYLPGPGMGPDALFATPSHAPVWSAGPLLACVLVGVLAGLLAALLTVAVYASEDLFSKLPIHWMWWPLIGGAVIGLGGIIYPPALGVGYDLIHQMLLGNVTFQMILGLLIVKSIIWAVSLSSGTSGGVLAPLLLIGGALGGLEVLLVREVMNTNVVALNDAMSSSDLRKLLGNTTTKGGETLAFRHQRQRLYPVLDTKKCLIGVVTSQDLKKLPYKNEDAHND